MADITFRIVDQFFDRAAVIKAVNKAKRKNLGRAGGFVRKTARRSMRPAGKRRRNRRRQGKYRKGQDPTISRPGRPPRLHTTKTKRNLKLILFAWEPSSETVIVGPVRFHYRGNNVPELMEYGGRGKVPVVEKNRGGGLTRTRRTVSASYRPRPFMAPALKKAAPSFPDLWKDSVKG